eukprot:4222160-Karenia_brevis.AAC.1
MDANSGFVLGDHTKAGSKLAACGFGNPTASETFRFCCVCDYKHTRTRDSCGEPYEDWIQINGSWFLVGRPARKRSVFITFAITSAPEPGIRAGDHTMADPT